MRQGIEDRFRRNVARVRHLVDSYGRLAGAGQGRRPVNTSDLLRAATVFLHATLEDLLRSIEMWRLPSASEARLDGIALVDFDGRPAKFFLGKLAAHRGKTVDEVIAQSIARQLQRSNYNTIADIRDVLDLAGIAPAAVDKYFPQLEELMRRRHHIVHQADRNAAQGRGQFQTQSISTVAVNRWIQTVEAFATDVIAQA